MYVRYGFMIELYRFIHSLCTCLARAAHDAIACAMEVEDSKDRSHATPEHESTPKHKSRDMEYG